MTFEEKTLSSEYVYRGRLIDVRRDVVQAVRRKSTREIVEHPGGVAILALKEDGTMIMERQFRKVIEADAYEVPAGKLEAGEDPRDAALRGLKEETGYTAHNIRFLTATYPSIGFCTEKIYIYLCTDLEPGETHFDIGEAIDMEEVPIRVIYEKILAGEIIDAKTHIAVLMTMALIENGELKGYLR